MSSFPWLDRTAPPADGSGQRLTVARRELRDRCALLARLGMSEAETAARLSAGIAWEFAPSSAPGGAHVRPAGLADQDIAELVAEVYASKRF